MRQWHDNHWHALDDEQQHYGFSHCFRHLFHSGQSERDFSDLFDLAESEFIAKKLERLWQPDLLDDDYAVLFDAAEEAMDIQRLLDYADERCKLTDQARRLEIDGMAKFRVCLSRVPEAAIPLSETLGYCSLIRDRTNRLRVLAELLEALEHAPECERLRKEFRAELEPVLKGQLSGTGLSDEARCLYVRILLTEDFDKAVIENCHLVIRGMDNTEGDQTKALAAVAKKFAQHGMLDQAFSTLCQAIDVCSKIKTETGMLLEGKLGAWTRREPKESNFVDARPVAASA